MSNPTWLYHETLGAKLFANTSDIVAAGDGWYDTPAKFGTPWTSVVPAPAAIIVDGVSVKSAVELASESEADPLTFDPAAITINPDDDDFDGPVQAPAPVAAEPAESPKKSKKK